MNPFDILDSILADYASAKTRRLIHSLILLGVVLVTIWQAADGDWIKAAIALGAALYAEANRANTPSIPQVGDGDQDVKFYDADAADGEDTVSGNDPALFE